LLVSLRLTAATGVLAQTADAIGATSTTPELNTKTRFDKFHLMLVLTGSCY
jgi:hypothetical protein